MTSAEYIDVLWRVIGAMAFIIVALVGALWWHVRADQRRALDLQRCKDALGIRDE